ncbi:hypothetical protein [Paenibacillus nasutitermitis]|uniref:Uncharacterized protein n=1 Tax=Paenibacillus nasutitermitis TaxID=1652958 RepID=A0A916ZDI6_9BACL|nr:hypothetical protein [Paenibacillus nasutitermitis]GGD89997.1 hypothetical protein GCM10010911_55820 [Paenibacillus nasutitermitis]
MGLFVTVNKTKTTHTNSHNRNVNNSFNSTNTTNKNKTVYTYNEHHDHHHQSNVNNPPPARTAATGGSDDFGLAIIQGFFALAFFGFLIFFFVQYKELVLLSIVGVMAIGLFTAASVVFFKNSISTFNRYYFFIHWILVFGLIILFNNPLYPPENLEAATSKFTNIDVLEAPKTLFNLFNNGFKPEAYFLIFQIGGLAMFIFFLFDYFVKMYKLIRNKPQRAIKAIITEDIVFVLVISIFISGSFEKLILFLRSPLN